MTASTGASRARPPVHSRPTASSRRWVALAVLTAAIGLDGMGVAVVYTALPRIGSELRMSQPLLPWVMTGYAIAFAGFLLLGGRAADVLGRRPVFIAGIALYALGSLGAALAPVSTLLLVARLGQGIGAAVSGPAALALIPQLFTDDAERAKAMSVYAAVGASSFVGGLVLGGVLTQVTGWRSVFVVLAVVAALVIAVSPVVLPRGVHVRNLSLDLPGGALVSAGLIALVVGTSSVATAGLLSARTLIPGSTGLLLLSGFVLREKTARQPLLPLNLFTGAPVKAATAAGLVFYTAVNGLLYFAPLYMQNVLHYSPLVSGLTILPLGLVVIPSAQVAGGLLPRIGFRWLLTGGLLLIAVGVASWLTTSSDTRYWTGLLPGIVIMAIGQGVAFTAMTVASLTGVEPSRHGVAGAVNITTQQVGAGLGVAVVTTIAAAATAPGIGGEIGGYHAGIAAAAVAAVLGAAATAYLLPKHSQPSQ